MKKLAQRIIGDFKIDTGESLANEMDNITILLKGVNGAFPSIQVEYSNRIKEYKITRDIAFEIRESEYIIDVASDRPYSAFYVDGYWFLLDNK